MGSMIYLSECKDESILKNFEKLKSNIPIYMRDEAEYNPFIQYIESVGRISEDLLDFLYHSDFLSFITEQTIPVVKNLYIRNAEIEWFYLIQKIFEEFADEANEYVTLIMECFECKEDVAVVEELLETSETSDVNAFRKKVEEITRKEKIGTEKNAAEEYESEYFMLKAEIERLKKDHSLKDKFIKVEKKRNAELIMRIQELEDTNEVLVDKVFDLEKKLEAANGKIDPIAEDADDFESKLEEEDELSDVLGGPEHEEDYSNVSFIYDETVEEESAVEDIMEEADQQAPEPYEYTDIVGVVPDKGVIKKKCRWFLDNLFEHSRKNFLKKSKVQQENLIFMKMMEMHLPIDYQRNVRDALNNMESNISCFDLYKLICNNPTKDELMSFLSEFQMSEEE